MDELHARVRAFRSLPTELNLAKQPDADVDDTDYAPRQSEANVVEMPQRQSHEAFVPHPAEPLPTPHLATKRKQNPSAKRKAAAGSQSAFPFQQMRDGHQQPYIDELKRLEAQAERINQLLADRKRKQASAEQAARFSGGQSIGEPLVEVEQAAIKKKAPKSVRQPSKQPPRSPQREVLSMAAPDDETEALEAQAERITQLLQALESAIVAGEALPPTGTDRNGTDRTDGTADRSPAENRLPTVDALATAPIAALDPEAAASSTYRYGAEAQAFAVNQNQAQATTGTTDQKAQQEAAETAQALRYLASRELVEPMIESVEPTIVPPQPELRRHAVRSRDRRSGLPASPPAIRRYGATLRQFLQMPQASLDRIGDAVLWIVLAAAIRVGARFLLVPFPALTPVLLVLMFAPAAVAVYLAMFVPKAGFVSIYRLFLIMLGLLLGGRF